MISDNARTAFSRLREYGMSPELAAGLVGNMMQESGPALDTDIVGDNGNSFGAVQWNGPRKRAFFAWANAQGADPRSIETQVDYVVHELNTSERRAANRIVNAKTPQAAAVLGSRHFWRPGVPLEEARARYAAQVYDALGGTQVAQADMGTMTDATVDARPPSKFAQKFIPAAETATPAERPPSRFAKRFIPGADDAPPRKETAPAGIGNPPPAGMTAQEAAEAAMAEQASPEAQADQAYRSAPVASGIGSALAGVPFVGEYVDEGIGLIGGDAARDRARMMRAGFEAANPGLATGLQIGTGVATAVPAALAAGPAIVAAAPASILGQVGLGAAGGALAGAAEGAVSGFGAGVGGVEDRAAAAGQRALVGGALGGVMGGATPVIAAGAANAVRAFRGVPDASAARRLGTSPVSAQIVGQMIDADDAARAQARIAAAGPDAMVADAGPTTAGLLDSVIQTPGPGTRIAQEAVEGRAISAARDMSDALDIALGRVPQIDAKAARDTGKRMAAIRAKLYDRAYAQPIDYAAKEGQRIEGLLGRVPGSAIRAANELMRVEGVASRKILAEIAPDGSVTFRSMPDVRQLDYITRGLNQVAEAGESAGALGGRTPVSRAYSNLSREIRRELKDAVPAYRVALERAATDIGIKQARELGEVAMRPQTSRGELAETLLDMGAAEKKKLAEGVRVSIDDTLARVRRTGGSGDDTTAREGLKALTELSSRESRDKLRMILGKGPADALMAKIDQAGKAYELRQRVAQGSQTAGRLAFKGAVEDISRPGVVGEMLQGSPVRSAQRLVQSMTAMTPQARQAAEQRIAGEIATLLTGPRGPQAAQVAGELVRILQRQPVTEALARQIGQAVAATTSLGVYQAGTRPTAY